MRTHANPRRELSGELAHLNQPEREAARRLGSSQAAAENLRKAYAAILGALRKGQRAEILSVDAPLTIERAGDRVTVSTATRNQIAASTLRFAMLINSVGASRVRQCGLTSCNKWFVATRRQAYCSPAHRARAGYEAWVAREEAKEKAKKARRAGR